MGKREARFKKLNDDVKVLAIGSLFRGLDNKSWAVNVDFNGGYSQSMQFSNVPILARKRVLNATKRYDLAGAPIDFVAENSQEWSIARANECPAYRAHRHGGDSNQWCFVVDVKGTRVFIPQLELARVLFYHDPFLARLSLQHNALAEDFMIGECMDGRPHITVREGADYPVSYFNRDDNRRFLSWVLLDSAARASFESISINLVKNRVQRKQYQHWDFQFSPPPLNGVEFAARGWEDRRSRSFFVWEITKLNELPSDIGGEVDFYHPGFKRRVGGAPIQGDGGRGEAPEQLDLDDEEFSDVDKTTLGLISERVVISFRNPHITNRIASENKAVSSVVGEAEKEVLSPDCSPNGKEDTGSLPGAAWNNLDDQSDDAHLYLNKFSSFSKMVDVLVEKHGCDLVEKTISKLPKINDGTKHRLADTFNPRCMATVELNYGEKSFVLLEVDTSDSAAKMSTMLLTSEKSWARDNRKAILRRIVKKSLAWPRDFFNEKLGKENYVGMPHPQSKRSGGLAPEAIEPWAQRIAHWINSRS